MADRRDLEPRLAAVEARVEDVATVAADARHLAAAHDRDLADLGVKVDANRRAINALGEQTAGRFDRLETEMRARFEQVDARFDQVDAGFAEMRAKFDQTAAGHQRIVELITDALGRPSG